jgi:hypothetical protein
MTTPVRVRYAGAGVLAVNDGRTLSGFPVTSA